MAKIAIKSEKLTPFGGFFSIMEQFDSMLSPILSTRHLVRDAAVLPPPLHTLVFDGEILLCRIYKGVG